MLRGPPTVTRPVDFRGACSAIQAGGTCALDAAGLVPTLLVYADGADCVARGISFRNAASYAWGAGQPKGAFAAGALAGAVSVLGGASVRIQDCEFSGNKGDSGGALRVQDAGSRVAVERTTFTDNRGLSNGGSVSVEAAVGTFTNCTFQGSSALFGGGMAIARAATVNLENPAFGNNTADVFGDDVYVDDPNQSLLQSSPFPLNINIYPSSTGSRFLAPPSPPPTPPYPIT
ncbi:hypothetical protein H632_c4888p0, partial [Helicosporidium sp. ATCC 50920]